MSRIANAMFVILLIGFLIGLYQAAFRGGDLQALAGTAIKYLVVAMIVSNWAIVFRGVNGSFDTIANSIGSSSGAGDMFQSWMGQLQQQFANNPSLTLTDIITGDAAATSKTTADLVAAASPVMISVERGRTVVGVAPSSSETCLRTERAMEFVIVLNEPLTPRNTVAQLETIMATTRLPHCRPGAPGICRENAAIEGRSGSQSAGSRTSHSRSC